jgi:hypothetical protein
VRWDGGPNAGLWSSVADFDADSDTLTFDSDLPNAVANTHTFTLFHCGKHISDQRIPGLSAGAPVNVTGFSLEYAAMCAGAGTGVLKFYYHGGANQSLSWTPPGGTEGLEVDVSALALNGEVAIPGGEPDSYILVKRTAASLPAADAQDDIVLTVPEGTFLPVIAGQETESGVTLYRPVGLKNSGAASLYGVRAYCLQPWVEAGAVATTIAVGGGVGTGADTLLATSLSNWGTCGFVYNSTKDDLRYYYDRSGNSVKVADPAGGIRGFTAAAWEDGDDIEPYPFYDIGLDAPGAANVFEDPASETTAPTGVAFSAPIDLATALVIGDMAAGSVYCVWQRWHLPAVGRPIDNEETVLRIDAEVSS